MAKNSRLEKSEWVPLHPLGLAGLDLSSNAAQASGDSLTRGENIRLDDLSLRRRYGAAQVFEQAGVGWGYTFTTPATDYFMIPNALHLQDIGVGGWAIFAHFTADRPVSTQEGYILSSRVNGQAYHSIRIVQEDDGTITVEWTKDSDQTQVTVVTAAVANGADVHLLAIHDAPAGTFTVYVNGAVSGTPVTGLATDVGIESPYQNWHIGQHFDPATSLPVANTTHLGQVDGLTLLRLAGTRPSLGLAAVLLRHSLRQWPAPQTDSVLFHYDFSGALGTDDRSRFQNDLAVLGTPAQTPAMTYPARNVNLVQHVTNPNGRADNVLAARGTLYYETVKAAEA